MSTSGQKKIVLIDYGMGNLRSVQKAFELSGAKPRISSSAKDLETADKIILPGVGAFTHAMEELKTRKLIEPLREKILSGTPYLGICLGLQLLFSWSQEGRRVKGFDIIPGPVKKFQGRLKIPHMGWNTVKYSKKDQALFKGVTNPEYFYFVHSYYGVPEDPAWVLGKTEYGESFCSALHRDNIYATQFHPEKSQEAGLAVIRNFIRL